MMTLSISQPPQAPPIKPWPGVPAQAPAVVSPYVGPAWFTAASYGDAIHERERTGKPLFLLFTAPSRCVYCRQLEAGALADPEVRQTLQGFVCVHIDVDKPESAGLVQYYGVSGIPDVMVYRGEVGKPSLFAGHEFGAVPTEVVKRLLTTPVRAKTVTKPVKFTNGFNCGASFCGAQGGPGCAAAGRSCPNSSGGQCVCGR